MNSPVLEKNKCRICKIVQNCILQEIYNIHPYEHIPSVSKHCYDVGPPFYKLIKLHSFGKAFHLMLELDCKDLYPFSQTNFSEVSSQSAF